MMINSKRCKKELNKKFNSFNDNVIKKLRGLKHSDPKSYWSLLNKYSSDKKVIINKITNEVFHEHFSNLNADILRNENDVDNFNVNNLPMFNEALNSQFTEQEIDKAIKALKNNKSPSIFDNIINEYLKNAPDNLLAVLKLFFNIILDSGIFPDVWSKGVILPLYKNKGDVNDPDNYRGITILSCFGKLFTSVLNNRLNDFLESNNILCEEQAGFRKHYSTVDHIFSLKLLVDVYLAHGKKLYCAFVDYRKAFDSVNRTAMWHKLLSYNIDGKCFKIIHNMYDKAKSCVSSNNTISDFFTSHTGVRQGENLSPILFSLFLNDLTNFMSDKYEGLQFLKEHINDMLSDDEMEVYLKLYLLLYADDTVILSESSQQLQLALNAMSDYCKLWNLEVNTNKTKVIIFWKTKRGLRNMPNFHYEGTVLEIVEHFSYLGVQFSFNGKFSRTKTFLIDQARKAMFSVIRKSRILNLPIDMQLHLFDTMIAPILLYGCEVWGVEDVSVVDKFQLKYLKIILQLKQSTPNVMIYGELGITPLSTQIKSRVLNYWGKIVNSKHDKIISILYRTTHNLYTLNNIKSDWVCFVRNNLNDLGLSHFWINQNVESPASFKNTVNLRLRDHFMQNWRSTINNSSKCLNYRIYKQDFCFEPYLSKLPMNLALILFKFRSMNHKLPIEKGRFDDIPRELRTCNLCTSNSLGDEFHYLFECSHLVNTRKLYLDKYFYERPSALKFEKLMNHSNKDILLKLAIFCKNIMLLFK